MNCVNCNGQLGEAYRVNQMGDSFCSDDCHSCYLEVNDAIPNDGDHPYIDLYENIRRIYLDWLFHWEEDLQTAYPDNPLHKADELNDKIDEILYGYHDFYVTEGDDGVFAREIYLYLLKLEKLQRQILEWRPERETYYYLSLGWFLSCVEVSVKDWFEFATYLYEIKAVNLFFMLEKNVHPYDELAFFFESKSHLDDVLQEFEIVFGKDYFDDLYFDEAYICEGECHDYEVIENVNMTWQSGWFFCDSCEGSYYPGFFSKKELLEEISRKNEVDLQAIKFGTGNWHFYIRKVKRSCRYHNVEFPDWIDYDYEF